MLKALEECTNASVAARYKTEKVASLAQRMQKWFQWPDQQTWLNFGGKDEPLPQEVKDKLANWTPAILELPREMQSVDEIFLDQFDSLDSDEFEEEESAEERPRPPTQRSRMKGARPLQGRQTQTIRTCRSWLQDGGGSGRSCPSHPAYSLLYNLILRS